MVVRRLFLFLERTDDLIAFIKGSVDLGLILAIFLVKVAEDLRRLFYLMIFGGIRLNYLTIVSLGIHHIGLHSDDCLFLVRLLQRLQRGLFWSSISYCFCFVFSLKKRPYVRLFLDFALVIIILYHNFFAFLTRLINFLKLVIFLFITRCSNRSISQACELYSLIPACKVPILLCVVSPLCRW